MMRLLQSLCLLGALGCTKPVGPTAAGSSSVESASDAIYFILVDRFDNGDRKNDGDADPSDPQAWHGGDLAGVTRRVPYLRDLGFGAVWLSPIAKARTGSKNNMRDVPMETISIRKTVVKRAEAASEDQLTLVNDRDRHPGHVRADAGALERWL